MIRKIILLVSPIKAATNGIIDIDVRGHTDYYGPLLVGSNYQMNHMVYDTMSDWTVIIDDQADN